MLGSAKKISQALSRTGCKILEAAERDYYQADKLQVRQEVIRGHMTWERARLRWHITPGSEVS